MCHYLGGRQLCCGPGKSNFRKSGVGEGSKYESLKDLNPETRSPEIFEDGRTIVDFNHWMLGKRGPSIHPIYVNS
jgi:hypothetical protein